MGSGGEPLRSHKWEGEDPEGGDLESEVHLLGLKTPPVLSSAKLSLRSPSRLVPIYPP